MSTNTEPTLEQLAELADKARQLTVERDEAILAAVNAGASQREAARAAGLSHTAVQHIVRRAGRGGVVKRPGWLIAAAGLALALVGVVLRVLEVGERWEVDGFVATKTYPAAMWTFIAGLAVAIVGIVVVLVGRRRHA